jgi:hypothetical protein
VRVKGLFVPPASLPYLERRFVCELNSSNVQPATNDEQYQKFAEQDDRSHVKVRRTARACPRAALRVIEQVTVRGEPICC